jgi:hypothetical protein
MSDLQSAPATAVFLHLLTPPHPILRGQQCVRSASPTLHVSWGHLRAVGWTASGRSPGQPQRPLSRNPASVCIPGASTWLWGMAATGRGGGGASPVPLARVRLEAGVEAPSFPFSTATGARPGIWPHVERKSVCPPSAPHRRGKEDPEAG